MQPSGERIVFDGALLADYCVYPSEVQRHEHEGKPLFVISAPSLGLVVNGDSPDHAQLMLATLVREYLADLGRRNVVDEILVKKFGWRKNEPPEIDVICPEDRKSFELVGQPA